MSKNVVGGMDFTHRAIPNPVSSLFLTQFASEHGLASDPDLRHSLRADEGSLVTHITSIFDSKAAEHDVLNLEGDSAQCFLDVIQDVRPVSFKSSFVN